MQGNARHDGGGMGRVGEKGRGGVRMRQETCFRMSNVPRSIMAVGARVEVLCSRAGSAAPTWVLRPPAARSLWIGGMFLSGRPSGKLSRSLRNAIVTQGPGIRQINSLSCILFRIFVEKQLGYTLGPVDTHEVTCNFY